MSSLTLRARWVVPVTSAPIENGHVVLSDDYITAVGQGRPQPEGTVIDLGDSVLLPGLINAHTHLALTALRGQVPYIGSFVGWIRSLRDASAGLADPGAFRLSVESGLQESLASGVTTVLDIGYGERSVACWRDAVIRVHGFLEVLGMGAKRWGGHVQSVEPALEAIRAADPLGSILGLGLSPHAPYSTDPIVYKNALQTGKRVCTHLAESLEELQFLRDGTGPFRELLEEMGLWDGSFVPPRCSPVEYMRRLKLSGSRASAPILVHCNYLSPMDLSLLETAGASVVYCPRAHAFFRHPLHPWQDLRQRGVNVCLGTDSLASNETLSVLDELRFLATRERGVSPGELLELATYNGARAIGHELSLGALAPGRWADCVAIPLRTPSTAEPLEDLLQTDTRPTDVFVCGKHVLQRSR